MATETVFKDDLPALLERMINSSREWRKVINNLIEEGIKNDKEIAGLKQRVKELEGILNIVDK